MTEHENEDTTYRICSNRDKTLLTLRGGVFACNGRWIEKHNLGIGKPNAVLG